MRIIETERLILRHFTPDDLDALSLINSDAEVMKYIGDGSPQSREQTSARLAAIMNHWEQHGFGPYAIVYKEHDALIGFCGLQFLDESSEVEVGYRLASSYWGKGIATECAAASLLYGFSELGLGRIVAVAHPSNKASQRVLEKIGLRYEKEAHYYNANVKYYAITRAEYKLRAGRAGG
jgi:ribosomal-protein-alanine N-acetyltransferase